MRRRSVPTFLATSASLILMPLSVLASTATAQGLLPPLAPWENPVTPAKALLGKILFWEEQLSSDGTVACGMCHQPGSGGNDVRMGIHPGPDRVFGTADDAYGSPGFVSSTTDGSYRPHPVFGLRAQVTKHMVASNTMAAYFPNVLWNGAAGDTFINPQTRRLSIWLGGAVENVVSGTPLLENEFACAQRTWEDVVARLAVVRPLRLATNLPPDIAAALAGGTDYGELMRRTYGDRTIDAERVIFAVASYMRTFVPDQTPWDRYVTGSSTALTPDQRAGLALFEGAARCSLCHPPPLFSDMSFRNSGIRPASEDIGWQAVTSDPTDRGKFKVPSLRNAGLRARFMHNGRLPSLTEVIEFYDRGGGPFTDNKDPQLVPLGLTATQKAQLVDFVTNGLTDPRVAAELPPFDRPILHSARLAPAFGDDLAGSGGYVPRPLADAPLHAGNYAFRVGLADALGGAGAVLAFSTAANPGQWIGGIPVNIALSPAPLVVMLSLSGTGAGGGYATLQLPIPDSPGLIGLSFFHQWFVLDPGAPGGVAASKAAGGVMF